MRISKLMEYSPVLLAMIIVLVLSLHMHWQGDAVAFSFFIPAENEDFSSIQLNSVWDIWPSMCNHWHNSTGRFFTHAIVQLFCAFIGKTGFAVCNALVWGALILMLMAMTKLKSRGFSLVALASLLTFILFFPLNNCYEQSFPFEPPHQINYVWMGLLNLIWINIFLNDGEKKKNWVYLLPLAVLSFLSGQSNESFSIPIGGGILVYAFHKRFDMSFRRYVMAICYGIGAMLVVFAPGNFQRIGYSHGWSLAHTAEGLLPGLLVTLIFLLTLAVNRRKGRRVLDIVKTDFGLFFFTSIIINFMLGICLGMGSGVRMLTCANLLITILILQQAGCMKIKPFAGIVMMSLLIFIGIFRYESISRLNYKNTTIEKLYHESSDGVVVLPDELFLRQVREFIVRPHPYMMKERAIDPSKPNIAIRPMSMMSLPLDRDTNMMFPLSDQAWLMIQSKASPAKFKIGKILLPGLLDRHLADRLIDWRDAYSVFDSTELWRAAIYINERPYLHSNITIEDE
ncbi:MAG: hypothetical protein K2H38_10945 [Muribaculaceae bacterium]|nr:hypothetical protein [Muribaculaceae bacterium]MDE6552981.1 hypothetical protein [Muribaculaceae bacterium]